MPVNASGSMDCDGHVAVVVINNTAGPFHGYSATSSSWIVAVDLAPSASTTLNANVGPAVTTMAGSVTGDSVEGRVTSPWSASRPAECGAVPTYVPSPVDTTPRPVPTSAPGEVQLCRQPGSNPPEDVPCDSPLATTPYVVPTSAAVDQPVDNVETTAVATTDTDTVKARAVVTVRPKAVHPTQLPTTGPGDITSAAGISGLLALMVGVILVTVRRRGVSNTTR